MRLRTQEQLDERAKELKKYGPEYAATIVRNGKKAYRAGGTRAFSRAAAEKALREMFPVKNGDSLLIEEVDENNFRLKK